MGGGKQNAYLSGGSLQVSNPKGETRAYVTAEMFAIKRKGTMSVALQCDGSGSNLLLRDEYGKTRIDMQASARPSIEIKDAAGTVVSALRNEK